MPRGNLMLVRNSDSSVIATGVPTIKSAQKLISEDMISLARTAHSNGQSGNIEETYTVVTPKEVISRDASISDMIDTYGTGDSNEDTSSDSEESTVSVNEMSMPAKTEVEEVDELEFFG